MCQESSVRWNNLIGSINLINASVRHGVKCFVFTSSIAVYGALEPPMREDMAPRPEDPYGVAKLAVEMDLHAARHMFGLDYVVFRPHNVYGEYQNIGDRYRNVVGIFMNQLMQGQPLSVFGDGQQQRAFTYIGDIAPIIARSAETPAAYGEVFNVGADTPYTVNELAGLVMDAMGTKGEVRHLEARNEVVFAFSDHSKAARVFGEVRETTLEEGTSPVIQQALETLLREVILPDREFTIERRWSGVMGFGRQGKEPLVERLGNRIVTAVRLSGMGVAIGPRVARRAVELLG